ncbi:MAG TPA: GNAT family N-acetyltransferase [Terriglobales bacterium]
MSRPHAEAAFPISIRPAVLPDCQGILDCLCSAFAPYKSSYTPGAYADTVLDLESLQARLREMSVLAAVTPSGSDVVGTISFSVLGEFEGHLRGMAVRPEWQGHGIARMLLESAETGLRARNCGRVTLDTTPPLLAAISFYERNGYAATGRERDFFGMPLLEYAKRL